MSAVHPDHQLEAEIRAMLQRRAQDIEPHPPAWRELAQRNGAIVISLRTGAPVDREASSRRRRPGRQWFRGVLAAAVALIVAMAGALLVQGSRPGSDPADGPEPLDVPAAGQNDFDPARATPLFPVTDEASPEIARYDFLGDATTTAERYLATVLPIRSGRIVIEPAQPQTGTPGDSAPPTSTATVDWSFRSPVAEQPPLAEGRVWLRNAATASEGRATWLVVGVATFRLGLDDIRREGDTLTFTVDRSTGAEHFTEPAEVSVNDKVIGGVRVGEVQHLTVLHPSGSVAIIQVRFLEDGIPVAVTATAVPAVAGGAQELPDRVPVPSTPGVRDTTVVVEPAPGTDGAVVLVPADPVPPTIDGAASGGAAASSASDPSRASGAAGDPVIVSPR